MKKCTHLTGAEWRNRRVNIGEKLIGIPNKIGSLSEMRGFFYIHTQPKKT